MREVEFSYYMTFGKGDSGDGYCEIALEDDQYERLLASVKKAEEEGWEYMSEDPDIEDIYDYVFSEIMDGEADIARDIYKHSLIDYFTEDMDEAEAEEFDLSEISNDEIADWMTDRWSVDIWFPSELLDEEEDSEEEYEEDEEEIE